MQVEISVPYPCRFERQHDRGEAEMGRIHAQQFSHAVGGKGAQRRAAVNDQGIAAHEVPSGLFASGREGAPGGDIRRYGVGQRGQRGSGKLNAEQNKASGNQRQGQGAHSEGQRGEQERGLPSGKRMVTTGGTICARLDTGLLEPNRPA